MINAMFGAVTGLNAAAAVSAVTANNIANVKTSGYKSNSAFLSELSTGGVKLSAIRPNNNQGSIIPTNVPSDIAVFGNGSEEDLLNTYSYAAGKFAVDDLVISEVLQANCFLLVLVVMFGLMITAIYTVIANCLE